MSTRVFSSVVQFAPVVDGKGNVTSPAGGSIRVDDGTISPPVLHLAPGVPIPTGATVLMDGTAGVAWSWGQFATAYPLLSPHVKPNEWNGERTAQDVTTTLFPLLAPVTSTVTIV